MKREAVVAGYFYPRSKEELIRFLSKVIKRDEHPIKAFGCISPHAGYIYSGEVAGKVYSSIRIPETAILIGPNHRGLGYPCAIYPEGSFKTPLGEASINEALAHKILQASKYLKEDFSAHIPEHSLEVQIPFLQYINPQIKIVPITMADDSLEVIEDLAESIHKNMDDETIVIASSDFSHYIPHEIAKKVDYYAIESILNIDPFEFYNRVVSKNLSICGYAPITVLLIVMKKLGIKNAKLIDYKTSGDVTRDYTSVVGYAGIIFY